MEMSLIEKMNKSKYNLIKWFTVGWTIWFGGFILKDLIFNKIILGFIIMAGLTGWVLFVINIFRLKRFVKTVTKSSNLKQALSDELSLYNRNKSFVTGYYILIAMAGVFFALSVFTDITALVVSEVILYVGVLSSLISLLIYNRY
jgi:divalent metal cation (Fe/Co/Zn/Cd) transporter